MQIKKELPGKDERFRLLSMAAESLMEASDTGRLSGQPTRLHVTKLSAPRVGALYITANISDVDKVFTALSKKDCAIGRQIFSWDFGHIACYFENRRIRLEASWPPSLAITDVRFSDCGSHPKDKPNVFFPGINEHGDVVAMTIDDACPHLLVGGHSGSGKSVLLRNTVMQFSSYYPTVRVILVDGKQGEGLFPVAHAQGQIGPIAITMPEIRAAISCVLTEMQDRYARQPTDFRDREKYRKTLIPWFIFLDEIQEIVMNDSEMAEIIRKLAAQSRAVDIHLILSTQKPLVQVFGDSTTKSNVPGRLALRTVNYKDSELVVGSNFPRADYLQPWEAWVITPSEMYRRTQLFNVTEKELSKIPVGKPEMDSWPAIDMADAIGQFAGPIKMNISPPQAIISIIGAQSKPRPMGQPALQAAWEQAGDPEKSSTKARAKRDWGRRALAILHSLGMDLCPKKD